MLINDGHAPSSQMQFMFQDFYLIFHFLCIVIIVVIFIVQNSFPHYNFGCQEYMFKREQTPFSESEIIVKKEREGEYQRTIQNLRKDARRKFFTQLIQSKLNQVKGTEQERQRINALFMEKQLNINLDGLQEQLEKYRKQIFQLKQTLNEIEEQYQRKIRYCLPMQQIINNNFNTLTVIRIQYQLNKFNQYRYQISAFELFRVVHINKLLHEVTIKGVKVQQFQQFTNLLNRVMHNKPITQKDINTLSWIKSYIPQKFLKLSINARVQFVIKDEAGTLSKINDLEFFKSMFYELSDIIVWVRLGQWQSIKQLTSILQKSLQCLRKGFKRLDLKIQANLNQITVYQVSIIRSVLFGGLTFFTEIAQLSFYCIGFRPQTGINDYLAIEHSLITLFDNNAVTHLELYFCTNLPVFPKVTLQSIYLMTLMNGLSFLKKIGYMREATQNNPSLRSIKCSHIQMDQQQWKIDEKLFNQLQTLIFNKCNRISFVDISSHIPSNIKHLQISNSNIEANCLSVIFPKLIKLTYLKVSNLNLGHQILCIIPSPNLQELHIWQNSAITNGDLVVIDSKWPSLSSITLCECSNLTESIWSVCEFKELMQVSIAKKLLGDGNTVLEYLVRRGIKVYKNRLL